VGVVRGMSKCSTVEYLMTMDDYFHFFFDLIKMYDVTYREFTHEDQLIHQYHHPHGSVEWYPYERSSIYVSSIYINQLQRRNKLGTLLMKQVALWALQHRYHTIKLDNCCDRGNMFYESLGFVWSCSYDNEMKIRSSLLLIHCNNKLKAI